MTNHSNKNNDGFALVIALSLMAFVLLLILSITTLVQVETAQAQRSNKVSLAQQNAILGLQVAIGELQKTAGPDQRVTASADILSDRSDIDPTLQNVTGVWKSGDITNGRDANLSATEIHKWSVQKGADNASAQDAATGLNASTWQNGPYWLLSSEQRINDLDSLDSDSLESANPTLKTALMLRNRERLDTGKPGTQEVDLKAGIVPLNAQDNQSGGYAWWVGDEGVKVKINAQGSYNTIENGTTAEDDKKLFALTNTVNPGIPQWTELTLKDDDWKKNLDRLVKPDALLNYTSYSSSERNDKATEFTDDWTTHSSGILANVRDGGLKKDLSRGLGDQFDTTLAGRPIWWVRNTQDHYLKSSLWDVAQSYANSYRSRPLWLAGFGTGGAPAKDQIGDYNQTTEYYYIKNISQAGPSGFTDPTDSNTVIEPRGPTPVATTNTQFVASESSKDTYANATRWYYKSSAGASDAGFNNPIGFEETPPNNNKQQQPIQNVIAPVVLGTVAELALSSATAADLWDLNLRENIDFAYWTREKILSDLSLTATDEIKSKLYNELKTGTVEEQTVATELTKFLALHVIIRPYAMVWNPYNASIGNFDIEVRCFPGYFNQSSKPVPNEYDFTIIDNNNQRLPFRVPSDKPEKNVSPNFTDSDELLLGSLTRRKDFASRADLQGLDPYNVINMKVRSTTGIAPGQIQLFAMDGIAESSTGSILLSSSADLTSSVVNGVVSAALPHKELIPRGTIIKGIQHIVQEASDYPNNSWGIDLYMSKVNSDTANQLDPEGPNSRVRAIAASIPSIDAEPTGLGDTAITRLLDEPTAIEDLSPAGSAADGLAYDRNGNSLKSGKDRYFSMVDDIAFRGVQVLGYLASLSLPADRPAEQGLPLFAQFNPAAQAFLKVSNNNPGGFMWSTNLYDLGDLYVTPGIEAIINGAPRWGNQFGTGGQEFITVYDIPRYPLQSVGSLMHADLGIFDVQPTYTVGAGYASPFVPLEDTFAEYAINGGTYLPDAAYLYNEALFDEYFFSSVPNEAAVRDNNATPPFRESFDDLYLTNGGELPNPRMIPIDRSAGIAPISDFDTAAANLMVDGAFNVNSTSALAWKAMLASLQDVDIPGATVGNDLPVLRSSFPGTQKINNQDTSWNGFRALSENQLDDLASAIVEQVRERGPFISMADFVNRRLTDDDLGKRAALQTALDDTINNSSPGLTQPAQYQATGDWDGVFNTDVLAADQSAGNLGWLLQNDFLKTLAPALTPRSDTFKVRGYGCTTHPTTGEIDGEAWCEAVVQRYPEYIDSSPSEEPAYTKEWRNDQWVYAANTNVSTEAGTFGRRFKIVSFRWLSPEEL